MTRTAARSACRMILFLALGAAVAETPLAAPVAAESAFFAMDTGTRDAAHPGIAEQARLVAETGFAGIGWTGFGDPDGVRTELDRNGIRLLTVYTGLSTDASPETLAAFEEGMATLKGSGALLWLTLTAPEPLSSPAADADAVAILRRLSDAARQAGVRIALYPHTGMWLERVEDAVRIARKTERDNVGATFNLCHWLRVDGRRELLPTLLRHAGDKLFVVTVNGADAEGRDWNTLIQTLDRGSFPVARLLATLGEVGFTGPIGFQGYGIGGDARDNLTRTMAAWRAMRADVAAGTVAPFARSELLERIAAEAVAAEHRSSEFAEYALRHLPDRERRVFEQDLVGLLTKLGSPPELCRTILAALALRGCPEAVPAAARLLADPICTADAVTLLERTATEEAREALRKALDGPVSAATIPVAAALGRLGRSEAGPRLAQLARGDDPQRAFAALLALADIGTLDSADAIAAAPVPGGKAGLKAEALLRCAAALTRNGQPERAAAVCREILADLEASPPVRIAALTELAAADGTGCLPELRRALRDENPAIRRAAARLPASQPNTFPEALVRDALRQGPDDVRAILLEQIADSHLELPEEDAIRCAAEGTGDVRAAAWRALGTARSEKAATALLTAAAGEGADAAVAAEALAGMRGDAAKTVLLGVIGEPDDHLRAVALKTLNERSDPVPPEVLTALVSHPHAETRTMAVRLLLSRADKTTFPSLVPLLQQERTARELAGLRKALAASAAKQDDPDLPIRLFAAAIPAMPAPGRICAVEVIGDLGTEGGADLLYARLDDPEPEVRSAAVRALSNWPNAGPLERLRKIARDDPQEVNRILATRGVVRMIPQAGLAPRERGELLKGVLAAATQPREREAVFAALGNTPSADVLDLLAAAVPAGDGGETAREALLRVAGMLGGLQPERARRSLEAAAEGADPAFRAAAKARAEAIAEADGHITAWQMAGPFPATPDGGKALADVFPPETETYAAWQPVDALAGPFTQFITPGGVNLGALIGGTDCVAYLRTQFGCPDDRDAVLEIGSDDGIKVWLNGVVVHANPAARPVARASDKVTVRLRAGSNRLVVKVTQGTGEWGACLRPVHPGGSPMTDLTAVE